MIIRKLSSLEASLLLYSFYCFTMVLRWLPAVTVQMPIIMFAYLLLLIGTCSYVGSQKAINLLLFTVLLALFDFFFIFLQNSSAGMTFVNKIGANFTLFVVTFPILFLYSGAFEFVDKNRILKWVMIIISITAITTILGSFMYESPCRELATPYNTDLDNLYKSKNIGGYGFIYFLVVLSPLIMRRILQKFEIKYLIVLILSGVCIICSEYTTALLLFVLGIFLSIAIQRRNIVIGVVAVIAIIIVYVNLDTILKFGIELFSESYSVSSRLNMILTYRQFDSMSGDLQIRSELYAESLNSFLRNPIIGSFFSSTQQIGGHSEILDYLGYSGLLGVLAIIPVIRVVKNNPIYKSLDKDSYYIAMCVIAFFLALSNTYCAPELTYVLVIIPVLLDARLYVDSDMELS